MKRCSLIFILLLIPMSLALANCDLTRFRWECDIPPSMKPTRYATSLVYCGNMPIYVSKWQYDELTRYQRADINMILTVNGEYLDSPCIPAHR